MIKSKSCVMCAFFNFFVILSSREICIVFMSKSSLCTFCSVSEKGNWCDLQEFDVSMDKVQNDILAVKKTRKRVTKCLEETKKRGMWKGWRRGLENL